MLEITLRLSGIA